MPVRAPGARTPHNPNSPMPDPTAANVFLRKVMLVLAAGAVLLIGFGIAAHFAIDRLMAFGAAAVEGEARLLAIERATAATSRSQSVLREYILSGRPGDLEQSRQLAATAAEAIDALGRLDDMPEARVLARVWHERAELQQRAVDLRASQGLIEAAGLLMSPRGQELDEQLHDVLAQARAREQGKWLRLQALPASSWAREVVIAAVALLLAMFGWVLYLVLHYERQRERAKRRLEASEAQLRDITESLPVLIAELDGQERFQFHNRAVESFCGLPGARIHRHTLRDVLGEARHEPLREPLERVKRGEVVRFERTERSATGETLHLAFHLFPRTAPSGPTGGFYVLGTDITPLKQADQLKNEFISVVSHELRTPLTSIRGSLGLVAGGVAGELPPKLMDLIGIARSNCDRLVRLINDILDIEKIASGKLALKLRPLDLVAVARQAVAANEGFAAPGEVRLVLDAPAEPVTVRIDADRMMQVLTNLISNAVKFSPAGAEVRIRLRTAAATVRVEVADQGSGIPPEFQQRIFQKFSQADGTDARQKGGTGLGLHITRMLVERMGGTIGFDSPPGQGATFFFELPAWRPQDTPAEAPQPGGGRSVLACVPDLPRILHLEDDPDVQHVVSSLVADCAVCVAVPSLRAAREQLAARPFDLLLVDLELEDGSGWELTEDLQGLSPRPPLIVFSADDAPPEAPYEVDAFLVKARTSEDTLREAIRTALPHAPHAPREA